MKDNFTIRRSHYKDDSFERYRFEAVEKNNKVIFGAGADLTRRKDFRDDAWGNWEPSWGSCNKDSYEKMLPHYLCIRRAMKLAERFSNKK